MSPARALKALPRLLKIEPEALEKHLRRVGAWGLVMRRRRTRRLGQIEDTLQGRPMRREHSSSDVVAARIEKPVRQPMYIIDQREGAVCPEPRSAAGIDVSGPR